MDHFGPKNGALRIRCKNFLKFCAVKRANRWMKVIKMFCTEYFFVQDKWVILGPKMAHSYNSGSALRFF